MDTKELLNSIDQLIARLKVCVERGAAVQGSITNGNYFGLSREAAEAENAIAIRVEYENAGIMADIVRDYLSHSAQLCDQTERLIEKLKATVNPPAA